MLFTCKQPFSSYVLLLLPTSFCSIVLLFQNDISIVGAIKVNISAQMNVLKSFCDYGSEFPDTYIGVSKSFETSSVDRQLTAVRECVHCAWEQGMSPLSMPSGVAV